MSRCTYTEIGQMLHAYELDALPDDQKQQFEMHLYECDYCSDQLAEFRDTSRVMTAYSDFKDLTEGLLHEADAAAKPKKVYPFLRLLAAAVIIVALTVPVYYSLYKDQPTVAGQILELNPARSGTDNTIYLADGGNVEIRFYIADDFNGSVDLVIASVTGDTVVSESAFANQSQPGVGSIQIPVSDFVEGHYMLTAIPDSSSGLPERVYMFSVKQE